MPLNEEINAPLTTLTLFGFDSASAKTWAFLQMGLAGFALKQIDGLRFWKLLGSGEGGGFSLKPNFARYGLFAVWDAPEAANHFFAESKLMQKYRRRAAEIWTIKMLPIKAHGLWSKQNPFSALAEPNKNAPVAVLTRARIRATKLRRFWAHVPATSAEIANAENLIASIGIGEAPFVRQATFSLWRDEQAMQNFAYKSSVHREVVRKTRAENWYAEELFARFAPVASDGTWDGRDPLAGFFDE